MTWRRTRELGRWAVLLISAFLSLHLEKAAGSPESLTACAGYARAARSTALEPLSGSQANSSAEAVHQRSVVVDLHVDPLFWNERLDKRREVHRRSGLVDFPKLKAGGVDLSVFGLVTEGLPVLNGFRLLSLWNGWPPGTAGDPWKAIQYQLQLLDRSLEPGGQALKVRGAASAARALEQGIPGVFLGLEGSRMLIGHPERIRWLRQEGLLYASPVHLRRSRMGGSSFPLSGQGPLTAEGLEVVKQLEQAGIWIDLSHLSEAAFWQVLKATKGPVLVSHTGLSGVTRSWRNLSDEQIRAVAERDGVVGIIAAPQYLGGRGLDAVVRHLLHAMHVAGPTHVAIGTDLDGFVIPPTELSDCTQFSALTRALLDAGLSEEDIYAVLGGNVLRLLQRWRPLE